ncbi:MAG: M14 family zinc carboxypeptidase [Actinomycetota bacterium]
MHAYFLYVRNRFLVAIVGTALVAAGLGLIRPTVADATPVNSTAASYNLCARVYGDPQAYWPSPSQAPQQSPFAKGMGTPNCRASEFITYQEMINGNNFLENLLPDFVEFYNLEDDFGDGTDCATAPATNQELCSAGLNRFGGGLTERNRQDLYLLKITDERVPDTDKKFFAFPLSIHGIERAGVEGGTRAAEDLATWAWCEATANGETLQAAAGAAAGAAPDCGLEAPVPHPVLETQPDTSLTAGTVLKQSAVYFIYANPDGWRRGDPDNVPRGYMRYNGNSVDMNRDWPTVGYTHKPYTPWSEPETKGFGEVLQGIKGKWDGGIDLHGQLDAPAFSFTMLGASQRDFAKNQRILQTVKGAWEDAEGRLGWSSAIKPNDADASDPRLYGVQWGTVWDTIAYTTTGSFGDWIDSPLGLGADGIDNEMTLSHIGNCGTGTCFIPEIEQLHIDGNKSLIFAMLNFTLTPEDTKFVASGKIGYVEDPHRLINPGSPTTTNPYAGLPQQDSISGTMDPTNDYKYEFLVKGPTDGVYNGGLVGTANPISVGGFNASTTPGTTALVLEQYWPHDQLGEGITDATPEDNGCGVDDDKWVEINRYFNQNQLYFASGFAVQANVPAAGQWRICIDGSLETQALSNGVSISTDIDFTPEEAWEDPGQLPYNVSNMDFLEELKPYMNPGQLEKVDADKVLKGTTKLRQYHSLVIADNALPGYSVPIPTGPAQANLSFANPGLTTAPCGAGDPEPPCSEDFEFDVEDVNNQSMVVHIEGAPGSVDWDLYVQKQDPTSMEWATVGQSATGSASETSTILSPPPGHYRARVTNYSGGQPPSELTIEFSNAYTGPPVYPNTRTNKERDDWGQLLRDYVKDGGNLVLTDGALKALDYMNLIDSESISTFTQYAGYIGFTADGGTTDTYSDPLAKDLNQPGAAEGPGHRHQTYEPVPIGFPIQDAAGADYNGSFVTTVKQDEWETAGGRTAGTTTSEQVSLGELPHGKGQVRVIGALIPMPFEGAYHPFGLADYAVTYSGYQVFNNALQIEGVPPFSGGVGLSGCGRLAKLTNINKLFGTKGKDVLKGTAAADAICGGPGKDTVKGLAGNDVLIGGKANDRVIGGSGNDKLYLGAGNDLGNGGKGKDRIVGFKGDDRMAGGGNADSLNGQSGNDSCNGGSGRDKLRRCETERG